MCDCVSTCLRERGREIETVCMHVMPVCVGVCICVCMCYSPDQGSLVVDMRSHNSRTAAKPSDSLRECSTRPPSNLCTQQRQLYIHERDENNMYTTIVLLYYIYVYV